MLGARARLVLVLVLFHVGLATVAAMHSPDFAWVPSYFDDDDDDFLPLLISEQVPALVDPPRGWTPALTLVAAVATWRPTSRSRLAPPRARLRAPPCA